MHVKVCNFRSNNFKTEFIDSLINSGFAVITHHGVDYGLIKEAQEAWKIFFQKPNEEKCKFLNLEDPNLGYAQRYKETGVNAKYPDLKEFYHFKPNEDTPKEALDVMYKLWGWLQFHIGPSILNTLRGIGSEMDYVDVCRDSENTILRSIYYPALKDVDFKPGAVRAAEHEDINFITLLVAASSAGLQVKDVKNNWHEVPFEENSIVCNVGDMLQLVTDGLLKSTTHRVVNPPNDNTDRISMPLFIHPKGNTLLKPGFTAQQYLDKRLEQIYQKVK